MSLLDAISDYLIQNNVLFHAIRLSPLNHPGALSLCCGSLMSFTSPSTEYSSVGAKTQPALFSIITQGLGDVRI